MSDSAAFTPIRYADGKLALLDQTRLPAEEVWLHCPDVEPIPDAIRRLAARGAPAIGVAAAWGLVVAVSGEPAGVETTLMRRFDAAWQLLAGTRPTAVNLRWALDQGCRVWDA